MSVESAVAYINRMRTDEVFRHEVNQFAEDETASWEFIGCNGYQFTMEEFRTAQDEIYREHGITPL
ncbi:Nif11-like leader peptide family natural product precursor [Candidatus Methylospira mobilis]|uniref:Nif11-like leader peptide family natural product n=1 Tax=Candidatus Methylospira mobilis TaxID=1808979 RepID=A0A5Q0BD94_9GAMM|nr:Nif11-like leader peptide family natural product precursor [Candidatus Methylospira mobilis]QFY41499.1 Nif11-like leader peptide family natural product precursor [Candidatus Methylospira mobilis]WNV05272.1 Nif11-like leader peptide family natural product precursor [Candidatus Methylospira mobilis]